MFHDLSDIVNCRAAWRKRYHSMPASERAPRTSMDLLNLSVFLLCLAILNMKPMTQTAKFSTRMMNT